MAKFIIHGGKQLGGKVIIPGAKNEALKLIALAILTNKDVIIENFPFIGDTKKMLEIMQSMGAKVEIDCEKHEVKLNCKDLDPAKVDQNKIRDIRASSVIMGSIIARYGGIKIAHPGGCKIGPRPLDTHFRAFEKLGVSVQGPQNGFYYLSADKLIGSEVILQEFSVTATENILMAASLAKGVTILKKAAVEPEVIDLIKCLNKMGAKIRRGSDHHSFRIEGVEKLHGVRHKIIPDRIVAGTFAVLAAATKSDIKIINFIKSHSESFLQVLENFGVNFEVGRNYLHIKSGGSLKAVKTIQTNIFPGLPTDLQQPLAVLATQADGTTKIFERMFKDRFGYVTELLKMQAQISFDHPRQISVEGVTILYGAKVKSLDLRAGATLITAALTAKGQTTIDDVELIERGYEDIVYCLKKLGAKVTRVE